MKEGVNFIMSLVGRKRVNSLINFLIGGKVTTNLFSSSQRVKVKTFFYWNGEFKMVRGRGRVKFMVNFLSEGKG